MSNLITLSVTNKIATLALNNYKKRNALSGQLIEELLSSFSQLEKQQIRVVILRQEGTNTVWSAGHDVEELPLANKEPLPYDDPLMQLLRCVRQFPAPIIAMIHGSVWGGALDLVINCDMVIADDTASFAITPAKLGLPYNASGIQHFLQRLPINLVKELFFTAQPINAERALQFHLINHVVPADQLEPYTNQLAAVIASRSRESIVAFKKQAHLINEACSLNPETFEYIEQMRRAVYCGQDYYEGINAFLEKRTPHFIG